jgi:tetratricopeptide (TPR) repeat protein
MTLDPYAPHLRQADDLFAQGEVVKAGQIWQAILKQHPDHAEARAGLLAVKERLAALREVGAAAVPPPEEASPAPVLDPAVLPEPEPEPEPVPPAPVAADARITAPEAPPSQVPSDARATAPEAFQAAAPVRVITGALDPNRLLTEGCTLYDMGQIGDALRKWEQVLTLDPAHALARGYASGARRELGLPPLQALSSPIPEQVQDHHAEEDTEKLLREAVQLYDMGLVQEAITKWERVLVLEPQRQEVEGYLRQARTEVGLEATSPATPIAFSTNTLDAEALDLKLRQGEHLQTLQRYEEAAFTFQQALALDPGNARALQGLERCRKPSASGPPAPEVRPVPGPVLTLDAQGRIAMAFVEDTRAAEPQGVEPPATLLKEAPAPREGPSLPDRVRKAAEQMPWLKDPKLLAGIGGGVLVLAIVIGVVHSYRQDQALKEEVKAAREVAVAPVAQQAQAPDLAESPSSLQQEAEGALGTDPLRAYLRAETLVSRNPNDAAGAQLLEKARAGLGGGVTGASLPEFQRHLQNGDLEAALKVMDALLRVQPGDAGLRARAGRLHLTLCVAHTSQAKWDLAQEDLMRGRALFPSDKSWQARLKLLEQVKAMPKAQQPAWITLLG